MAQPVDALALVLGFTRVVKHRGPGFAFIDDESQARLFKTFRRSKLQFCNGQSVGVSVRLGWHVAVAESENAYIKIGVSYIFKTLVHGPLVRGDIILHRDDPVAAFSKGIENDAPVLF
jgi:hypothetical protein